MRYTATEKSPEIDNLLSALMGRNRVSCIEGELPICVTCGDPVEGFKNDISEEEYRISGMCQICQDEIFS